MVERRRVAAAYSPRVKRKLLSACRRGRQSTSRCHPSPLVRLIPAFGGLEASNAGLLLAAGISQHNRDDLVARTTTGATRQILGSYTRSISRPPGTITFPEMCQSRIVLCRWRFCAQRGTGEIVEFSHLLQIGFRVGPLTCKREGACENSGNGSSAAGRSSAERADRIERAVSC